MLRLVAEQPAGRLACAVLRILQVMGLDKLLRIYPSVPAALPAAPPAVA